MKFIKKYWLVGSLTGIFLFLSVSGFVFAITPPGGSGGTGSGSIATDASGNIGIRKNPDVGTTYELDVAGDIRGTSLTGTFLGDVPATRVSGGGTFGSLVSGGNYTFPASLGVGGVTSFGAKFDVDGGSGVAGRFKSSADGDTFIIYNSKIGVDRVVTRFANNSGWNVTGAGGIQRGYAVRNSDDTIELAAMRGDGSIVVRNALNTADAMVIRNDGSGYFSSYVKIGTTAITTPAAGMIRWTGTNFEGNYTGAAGGWASLGGGSGWTDDGAIVRLSLASDNVGIGAATAVEKLDVNGAIKIGTSAGTTAGAIRWNAAATQFEGNYGGATQWASLGGGGWTKSGANVVLSTVADNVGIGAVSSGDKLHVQGSARVTNNLYVLGGTSVTPAGTAPLEVYGGASPAMRVRNVPLWTMGASDNLVDLGNINSGDLGTILKITTANPNAANTANAAVMIGRVGISTSTTFTLSSNATNTLEVKGTIYADRVLNAVYAP
ncbi:MAG: hypothetical protein UY56_C0009G0005 [Parcubacteria group bacterium GW2011_GWA1_50_14]|uniref:Uncharacterized protein n=1 Tax=Candidatus Liptonbacteria bacterium GWB1_49_6 TaxID=1798644 RepID=A0A1G2C602_9BACT|nr:MAG: hypothetical protein UY56_C0009G0005 [Parcubacteria group bacterium GW2011_GWA1_50_14]OGY96179.1 MAG: hypothetical protein A2122_00105 [Candidatus Liptonbacteria bacterium GWB1_49_6]